MAASLLFTARVASGIASRPRTPMASWVSGALAPSSRSGAERASAPTRSRAAGLSARPRTIHADQGRRGDAAALPAVPKVPLMLAGLLVLLAVLLAPERPSDQAAICQRQAGELACRVW